MKILRGSTYALLLSASILGNFTFAGKYQWGGEGFDPSLKKYVKASSRFVARPNLYKKENLEILVDSEKTVQDVGSMKILQTSPKEKEVKSIHCSKAMKHIEAPWSCSFSIDALRGFNGMGKVSVFNKAGHELLQTDVDLTRLVSVTQSLPPLQPPLRSKPKIDRGNDTDHQR